MTRPAIFADLAFAAALEESKAKGKMLLVDATASWCQPCQVMDRTTWAAAEVIAALRDRAIAIQVDVDASADVASQLRIKAMPTVVAFQDGREVDRTTGLKDPAALLAWLDAVARGETSLDVARKEVAAKPKDMGVRIQLARQLVDAGRLDEATTECTWLWEHMLEHDPSMVGVKHSFFMADLQQLVALHPPAHAAFAALRDRFAPPSAGMPDVEALRDWFALSALLGHEDQTLKWYETVGKTLEPTDSLADVLQDQFVPIFIERERWADAGALMRDPVSRLTKLAEMFEAMQREMGAAMPPEDFAKLREAVMTDLREMARRLVKGLAAAGRADDVAAVRAAASTIDTSPEMTAALGDAS